MTRRNWPVALAVLFVAQLVWYLVYTERIVQALRGNVETLTEIYARVQEGITDPSPAGQDQELPVEALDQPARRKYFNRRREHDPLGEGQPCTWRTRLIKVAAEIVVSTRRVVVRLSGSWPYLDHYRRVGQQVTGVSPLFEPN